MKKIKFLLAAVMVIFLAGVTDIQAQVITPGVTIVELDQVTNAFEVTSLELKPGKYQFKVTNKDVAKEVGFVIQKETDKDGDVMKTALKNSFSQWTVGAGETTTSGIIELTAGNYVYSCPLNPTPKYTLTVK